MKCMALHCGQSHLEAEARLLVCVSGIALLAAALIKAVQDLEAATNPVLD